MTADRAALERQLGDSVEANVSLADHTYMKVGGQAEYFYVARTALQLIEAVRVATRLGIEWSVLGNGSNVLVSDRGIRGLVIQNRSAELTFVTGSTDVLVATGVPLTRLIVEAANHDLAGLEPLFGIPATVGGGVYGNIEAHNTQITQFVRELTLYKPADDKLVRVGSSWLQAQYRTTRLKNERAAGRQPLALIVMVKFALMRRNRDAILAKIREYDAWRRTHQPVGSANCGSVFRNHGTILEEKAGYLLEHAGAKTIRVHQAHVSPMHSNFVINDGGATAEDVRGVIQRMRAAVTDQTGIELLEEIEYLGDWSPPVRSIE